MTVQELCSKIELQECMANRVNEFVSSYNFEEAEDIIQGLMIPDKAKEAYEKLMEFFEDDEDCVKVLSCFLEAGTRVYEKYKEMGISEKIFVDTYKAFTRYTEECKAKTGKYAFDRAFWTYRHTSMVLFRLGELEFELKNDEGVKAVAVHIPSDAKLGEEYVDEYLKMTEEFITKHFPEYADKEYTCYSWLLAPKLQELLSEDSNIIKFQNRFDIHTEDRTPMSVLEWVFKVSDDADIATLPEDTSLQRKIKALLLSGDNVGIGIGRLKK